MLVVLGKKPVTHLSGAPSDILAVGDSVPSEPHYYRGWSSVAAELLSCSTAVPAVTSYYFNPQGTRVPQLG